MKQVIKEENSRPIKIWTNDIEDSALTQLKNLARLPFINSNGVSCMPDVHAGIGSTVGTVIATEKAIIPAAVGVDIGCVDADTEYLSPEGWKLISEYVAGEVMQYDPETEKAKFVTPKHYVVQPCEYFYHFKTKYGIDQMLTPDHRILCWDIKGRARERVKNVLTAQEFKIKHDSLIQGYKAEFLTSFTPLLNSFINLSDDQIRVQVMVIADSAIDRQNHAVIRLKKQRKIERARYLLDKANIEYTENIYGDVQHFRFIPPIQDKSLGHFWKSSLNQLRIISEECLKWDGNEKDGCFYTRNEESANFIQYAFTCCGFRAVKREDFHTDGAIDYRVFANINTMIGMSGSPLKSEISIVKSVDSKSYCFVLDSGFFVIRRNGNVAITGNCGMNAVRLSLKAIDLPDDLKVIRNQIERDIPLGAGGANKNVDYEKFGTCRLELGLLSITEKHPSISKNKAWEQLGSLGSGNHFIELCIDENQDVWIMLHSGSRGVGNLIGRYFMEKAKRRMEQYFISLPDSDLAYFPEDTDEFNDYVEAVGWAQNYALENRRVMMDVVISALRRHIAKEFTITQEAINCHHNYVEKEHHFGKNMWVTRKGAIRARVGDLGIIPGSMGQKSYIVRGKGNLESYCSCSHGAGRKMSRTQARKTFTVDDLKNQTKGVECRKDDAVLDEIPGSYKDIDAVMENQKDLIEIVHTLKQVLCVKGN